MNQLRDKITDIVWAVSDEREGDINASKAADLILAIPEIAEALALKQRRSTILGKIFARFPRFT